MEVEESEESVERVLKEALENGDEAGGDTGGEKEGRAFCLDEAWGRVRESGGMLAAMAAEEAVEDRWDSSLWLILTSTSGTERRKEAASWAQLE